MSARRKQGSTMKYRGFYCGDELWQNMQQLAEQLDESDSEYIRKAVEMRNNLMNQGKAYEKACEVRDYQQKLNKDTQQQQEFRTFFKGK